jgi:hypothetical protein
METELLEIDPEGISRIRDSLDALIASYRLYRFQKQIKDQIEGVFNALFGHVLKFPAEFLNETGIYDSREYAKIPAYANKAYSFVQAVSKAYSFKYRFALQIFPPWPVREHACLIRQMLRDACGCF